FAKIGVEPRPYQLVPLLMALKLNPVRLLIADDVGIGKTIEAGLIARELLDRGEIERIAILCPPQLAEQWQAELSNKFYIDAELVLPSTATRLERGCLMGESLFEHYPFVIVSTDFIKSDRRRDEFLRTCPELVIVDEAHTCAHSGEGRTSKHQRYRLLKELAAANLQKHLILVTATPHSGDEEAFRSLLKLLNTDFANLPENLTGKENEQQRRKLAAYFVQRRRADIRSYLDSDTPFPNREDSEQSYTLHQDYKKLFEKVLSFARELVIDKSGTRHRQRVKWWSAIALLRALASSPAAAVATLNNRAATVDTETPEEADELGKRTVLDLIESEADEVMDITPGSNFSDEQIETLSEEKKTSQLLKAMAKEAELLKGEKDLKLKLAIKLLDSLIKDGFKPILFCRFIQTAEYVAEELRRRLKNVEVVAVTGQLPPAERESRVLELSQAAKRVLVCTDCLSEGINLQEHFDTVVHYDLSWNPTRHEQREGRVDRYGQPSKTVRVLTYYGKDNQIDGIVLDVLLRKHKAIRSSLGVSVPVPVDTEQLIEAIFEGLLLREHSNSNQGYLSGFEELFKPQKDDLFQKWEATSEREKRSRTMFAQEGIKVEDVAKELDSVRNAIGSNLNVKAFTINALKANKAMIDQNGLINVKLEVDVPKPLRETFSVVLKKPIDKLNFKAKFELPVEDNQLYLTRTHPVVETLANYLLDTALDPITEPIAKRSGLIHTKLVATRTTVLLLRLRYHIVKQKDSERKELLAEEAYLLAFEGSPQNAKWLDTAVAERLLDATAEKNVSPEIASNFIEKVIDGYQSLLPHLEEVAQKRGQELLDAHRRVRDASLTKGVRYSVEPQLPPDILGVYVYLP
ncbi:MAG: DEAD/DEAH box helicase, partial [Blastocatellia bacterium]|nr:DEAD/DEAH box helicase [Blastocatellia bacterium]